ncbi:LysR family transcriptional regulator [Azospirillum sp. RWY-5-1]|uniref:LysR family transcriptional regulator n=1 Tax=Azospirillum oleiclasticum TaxID=2735135 RepID=A0ABX2TIX6_9PROT|nr:LysR family transcriptional regulator [Azospirillum oleiclasticum]NYZ14524.1 LysR family transcriptional regulator [Azospirillum oleiclasticum]NYZ24302.1 LysR family transcriptional regulator [Azospirillum oleiclasticum]
MDRRRLQSFVALCEELHFHRAAARCHMTQPALSQQLQQLEAELQVQLVHRNKRRVSLTRAGEVFQHEARRILRQMEHAAHLARQTDRGEIGRLSVAVTAPALYIVFPEIMHRFRLALPNFGVNVQVMTTSEQEAALRSGSIDVGIFHPPLDDRSLSSHLITSMRFNIVLSDLNPLAAHPVLRLEELSRERFIIFPRVIGPSLYDEIVALCQQAGFSPEVILEASPAQSIIALAAANFGIGLIASRLQQFDRPGVVYRPLDGPAPHLTLGVAYQSDDSSPAIRTFLDVATEVGRSVT